MKGTKEKISVVFLFVILLGANVANIQFLSSIVPKSSANPIDFTTVVCQEQPQFTDNELGYRLTSEVYAFLQKAAVDNNFQITSTVFSAALLIESEDAIIIIGHGHFDSEGNYFIGSYSINQLQQLVVGKQIVALLACYSARIKLPNAIQLLYFNEIILKKAIDDLAMLLNWKLEQEFTPSTNVALSALDPGSGVNGWTINNPPPLFNKRKTAYCPEYCITWDLNSETAIQSLSIFLYDHHLTAIRLNYEGEFLIETPKGSGAYSIVTKSVQYDIWNSNPGGVWDYLNFANLKIDGVSKPQYSGCDKFYNFENEMMNALGLTRQESKYEFASNFIGIGACLLVAGGGGIAFAFAATAPTWVLWLAGIGGIIAIIIGVVLLIIAIVVTISAYYTTE